MTDRCDQDRSAAKCADPVALAKQRGIARAIRQRIARLNSLVDGYQASVELTSYGAAAIEPLREFLLDGSPSGVFQPRQLAVEALAALGAKDALMDYLSQRRQIQDPVASHGEDAVKSTAARLLAQWHTEDVFQLLLTLARQRLLAGVITTLGSFRRAEALPVLERALEDDIARPAAEESLAKFGGGEIDTLVGTVARKRMDGDQEAPSSLLRRRAAAGILCNSRLSRVTWPSLRFLLSEVDPELVVHGATIATVLAPDVDKRGAVSGLLRVLPEAPWFIKDELAHDLGAC